MILTRKCHVCGREYPLTPDFWRRRQENPQGFSAVCKMCQLEKDRRRVLTDAAKARKRLTVKVWAEQNRARQRANNYRWREQNPQRWKEVHNAASKRYVLRRAARARGVDLK